MQSVLMFGGAIGAREMFRGVTVWWGRGAMRVYSMHFSEVRYLYDLDAYFFLVAHPYSRHCFKHFVGVLLAC